jgi:hypothetical protein
MLNYFQRVPNQPQKMDVEEMAPMASNRPWIEK